MEQLAALPVLQGGALAVLVMFSGWCLFNVMNQKWVTYREMLRRLAEKDAATEVERAEKAMWRDTALSSLEAARLSNEQTGQMLEGLKTVEQLLRGLMAIRDKT